MAKRKSTKGQTTILKTTNKTDRHDITEIFTGHAFVRSRIVKQILCLTHIFCILCLTHIFCFGLPLDINTVVTSEIRV